MEEVSTPYP